jgi:hypothetical protein
LFSDFGTAAKKIETSDFRGLCRFLLHRHLIVAGKKKGSSKTIRPRQWVEIEWARGYAPCINAFLHLSIASFGSVGSFMQYRSDPIRERPPNPAPDPFTGIRDVRGDYSQNLKHPNTVFINGFIVSVKRGASAEISCSGRLQRFCLAKR